MIEGWSKERGRVKDTRAPISPELLESICKQWQALCGDDYEEVFFQAASLLTFFGTVRISGVSPQETGASPG